MKKVYLINFAMIAVILFSGSKMFGQSKYDSSSLKLFGLGLHMEQFKLNDLNLNIIPANKIIVTLNLDNNWRLEPEFGFNTIKDKESDLKNKSLNIGIGMFGMYQRGKANIYGGLRFEYVNTSQEYNDDILGKQTEKTDGISFGPAVGVEFFFGHNFSIGGEVGLKYTDQKIKNSPYGNDSEQTNLTTESGLLLRFYL